MDTQIKDVESLSKEKGFKLVHMNVRSLTKKMDQMRVMLSGTGLDVITLSETWLDESVNSKSVDLTDYILYRQDRDKKKIKKKRGGGGCLHISTRNTQRRVSP